MAYTLNGIDLSTYGIIAGHAPSSNIAVQGCFDMPERTGKCFHEWGDEDGVEPYVLADELFFAGRDIVVHGSILGTALEINGKLTDLYAAINAASGLSVLETPYHSASGYVKSVIPDYKNGGCSLVMTFREPVVDLTGSLPAAASETYMIDGYSFSSFGLYLSKAGALHDLPELKEQQFTKYGSEGWQIVKRKHNLLKINGFLIGSSLVDLRSKIQSLTLVLSSAGTRNFKIADTNVNCFAAEGFKVQNIFLYDSLVIAVINMSLICVNDISFPLTSTGDGSGVTTLTMQSDKTLLLTLDGTGKFYTNLAGTLGESSTWTLTAGGDRTIYIRVPSGASNLYIPQKEHITRWVVWLSATNGASLGGNISGLTSLTYLHVSALNTLYGDISKMTSLTYIYLIGSNTISGSVAGLTSLTYLSVLGQNTLTGSITNLTSLTYLRVAGQNTLSGSIAGLTSLTYLYITGSNTVSGSIAALVSLVTVYLSGLNTISGSIEALTSLTLLKIWGSNTITGDLKVISGTLTDVVLNPCVIDTYTAGGDWSDLKVGGLVDLRPSVGFGLSEAECDLLIIEIENTRAADREVHIRLVGSNAGRTAASDAAVAAIEADGGSVLTSYETNFDNGKLVISFDDGTASLFTDALPLLVAQGVSATFYLTSDYVGNAGYMSWANAQAMDAAGMDMQCHTKTHASLTTLSQVEVVAELQGVNDAFATNSLPQPLHIAYPHGLVNDDVENWVSGLRNSGRKSGGTTMQYVSKNGDKYYLYANAMDNADDARVIELKAAMDYALANKKALIIYGHGVTVAGGAYAISATHLDELIDYAQAIGLDIITASELSALMI